MCYHIQYIFVYVYFKPLIEFILENIMLKKLLLLSMFTMTTLANTTYGSDDESYSTEDEIPTPPQARVCPLAPRKVRVPVQRQGNQNTARHLDFSDDEN